MLESLLPLEEEERMMGCRAHNVSETVRRTEEIVQENYPT